MSAEPRFAAACIIVRGDSEPRILLAQRSASMKFMAGHYVFPGGRIQDDENIARVVDAVDAAHARAIQAVVREVFEETGLLCVRGQLPSAESLRAARSRLLQGELDFHDLLSEHELTIAAGDFETAGEWLTPASSPIRFATRYFLYQLADDQQEELIEGEVIALNWFTAAEARARWLSGELKISTPVAAGPWRSETSTASTVATRGLWNA